MVKCCCWWWWWWWWRLWSCSTAAAGGDGHAKLLLLLVSVVVLNCCCCCCSCWLCSSAAAAAAHAAMLVPYCCCCCRAAAHATANAAAILLPRLLLPCCCHAAAAHAACAHGRGWWYRCLLPPPVLMVGVVESPVSLMLSSCFLVLVVMLLLPTSFSFPSVLPRRLGVAAARAVVGLGRVEASSWALTEKGEETTRRKGTTRTILLKRATFMAWLLVGGGWCCVGCGGWVRWDGEEGRKGERRQFIKKEAKGIRERMHATHEWTVPARGQSKGGCCLLLMSTLLHADSVYGRRNAGGTLEKNKDKHKHQQQQDTTEENKEHTQHFAAKQNDAKFCPIKLFVLKKQQRRVRSRQKARHSSQATKSKKCTHTPALSATACTIHVRVIKLQWTWRAL